MAVDCFATHFELIVKSGFIITMIRNNKQTKYGSSGTKLQTCNYRNAVFQGDVSSSGQREGRGLVYLSDSHRLIASNFVNGKANSHSLFFRSHSTYLYGPWFNNHPHGMAILRMNEVLILTEYKSGELLQGYRILYVFERYNVGLVI